jgi:hypothetical protein
VRERERERERGEGLEERNDTFQIFFCLIFSCYAYVFAVASAAKTQIVFGNFGHNITTLLTVTCQIKEYMIGC